MAVGQSVTPVTPVSPEFSILNGDRTILVYGDTGDGKTGLAGELIEWVYTHLKTPQGKPLRSIIHTADEGGTDTIQVYLDMGLVIPNRLTTLASKPWEWLNEIVQGKMWNGSMWVAPPEDIGLHIFEGMSSIGSALRLALTANDAMNGKQPRAESDKDAHGRSYGMAQDTMKGAIKRTFRLPRLKLWTALALRGDDADNNSVILGPQIVGKALTSEVPSWFNYTFRVMSIPADELTKQPERHRLYFTDHIDQFGKGAKGLGNNRKPLDGGELPMFIEPASLVKAFAILGGAGQQAKSAILQRLQRAGVEAPIKG